MSIEVASSQGVVVPVHDLGGDGAPLLMAHATGFHGMAWQPLAEHLQGFHAWAPDLRGHGDAHVPDDHRFAWNGFADDVLAVVGALGLEQPFGLGHSKGGAALLLAEQRRPGTFRALYLFEPVVFPTPPTAHMTSEDNPMAVAALRRRATFPSLDAAYENYARKPPLDALDPAALRAYVEHGFSVDPDGTAHLKCRPESEAQVYRMGAEHRAFAHLDEVTCPVVVARGQVDGFGPGAFAEQIVAGLPHGRLEVFEDLGHFGPLEDPARLAKAVERAFAAA